LLLNEASGKYKEKHPKVIQLQSRMLELEKLISVEFNRIAKSLQVEYQISKSNLESVRSVGLFTL